MTTSPGAIRLVLWALSATLGGAPLIAGERVADRRFGGEARAAQAAPPAPAAGSGGSHQKSFLKTRTGVIAIALFAGGFAYAARSRSHDRVVSPVR